MNRSSNTQGDRSAEKDIISGINLAGGGEVARKGGLETRMSELQKNHCRLTGEGLNGKNRMAKRTPR